VTLVVIHFIRIGFEALLQSALRRVDEFIHFVSNHQLTIEIEQALAVVGMLCVLQLEEIEGLGVLSSVRERHGVYHVD
jgi:hypothetical protein